MKQEQMRREVNHLMPLAPIKFYKMSLNIEHQENLLLTSFVSLNDHAKFRPQTQKVEPAPLESTAQLLLFE